MEAGLDLFAFDFSHEQEELYAEDNVLKQFKKLQKISKDSMNSYFVGIGELSSEVIMLIDRFVENGWVERRGNRGIYILEEHLIHHTVDEVITNFRNVMKRVSGKTNVCWYSDILSVINSSSAPIRWEDDLEKEFSALKNEVVVDYAFKFGLEHF